MSSALAKIAYEAYGKVTGGKNFWGDPMPAWDDLPQNIRDAWDAAVGAAIDAWSA
jgi:alpha-ketoglutarate-dependent taurine dioxygenase